MERSRACKCWVLGVGSERHHFLGKEANPAIPGAVPVFFFSRANLFHNETVCLGFSFFPHVLPIVFVLGFYAKSVYISGNVQSRRILGRMIEPDTRFRLHGMWISHVAHKDKLWKINT